MSEGFDLENLSEAENVLIRHVEAQTTPGATALAVRSGGVVARWAVGHHTYEQGSEAVRFNDIYDLASLTKIVATTALCMALDGSGDLDLEMPVQDVLSEFTENGRERVSVKHLLAHCSGLPAHLKLFETCRNLNEVLDAIYEVPLAHDPGDDTIYSDLGFILLGRILEGICGEEFRGLVDRHVLKPFGLREVGYHPGHSLLPRIPPTEVGREGRAGTIHGEVHDGNAAAIGGVAPHAGLFGPAGDLGNFLRVFLNGGRHEGHQIMEEQIVKRYTTLANMASGSSRALGWDTVSATGSSAGDLFSQSSFGHTGFTGTSMWADPERDLGVVLLTNRVHPSRDNEGIRKLRPEFHNAVAAALESVGGG